MPTVNQRTLTSGRTSYYVRVRDAIGRQTTETFTTRREAQQFAKLVEAVGAKKALATKSRDDKASDDYVPTLAEYMDLHLRTLTGVTVRTVLDYRSIGRRTFLPHLGALPLDIIDRADVAAVVNGLDRAGKSAKTIENAHVLLAQIFKSAVRDGLVDRNPCEAMRLPRTGEENRQDTRFLSRAEYEALLAALDPHWRPLVALLFGSGLRWGEASALRVGDVVPGPPVAVQVRRAWKMTPGQGIAVGPPKSSKARRDALLSLEAFALVAPLLDRPGDELLFTATRGGVVHYGPFRDRVWVRACRDAGLASAYVKGRRYDGPSIHDARHTHASWLLSTGQVTLEQLQDQLGHEDIRTTRSVYAQLIPETRNRLADALNSLAGTPQLEAPIR